MNFPDFTDVLRAKRILAEYLSRTPLLSHAALNEVVDATLLVKHENFQPTGAFKVDVAVLRGGNITIEQLRRILA